MRKMSVYTDVVLVGEGEGHKQNKLKPRVIVARGSPGGCLGAKHLQGEGSPAVSQLPVSILISQLVQLDPPDELREPRSSRHWIEAQTSICKVARSEAGVISPAIG